MLDIDDFSLAVAGVYDASMNIERWPDTLALLAKIFGGRASQIGVGSPRREVAFVKAWGWTDDELARFMPAYVDLDADRSTMGHDGDAIQGDALPATCFR